MNSATYEYKNNGAQFVPMGIPTDYKDKEFQHFLDINFEVHVRGIRMVFNKVMLSMIGH
jgi:hypothetical protein